jgi:hypothetical protein
MKNKVTSPSSFEEPMVTGDTSLAMMEYIMSLWEQNSRGIPQTFDETNLKR